MIADLVRRMTEAGAPIEAITIAIEAIESLEKSDRERKAKRAEQKRNERERRSNVARHDGDSRSDVERHGGDCRCDNPAPSAPQRDIIKPPTIPTPSSLRSEPREASRLAFDRFWDRYPNKVGKPVAERSFEKLWREFGGDVDPIMTGLDRYIRNKPDDRSWLNPSTFLNQRRFEDRPCHPQPRASPAAPRMTVSEMAHLDDPDYADASRFDRRPADQSAEPANEGGSRFAGVLPFENHAGARWHKLVDH